MIDVHTFLTVNLPLAANHACIMSIHSEEQKSGCVPEQIVEETEGGTVFVRMYLAIVNPVDNQNSRYKDIHQDENGSLQVITGNASVLYLSTYPLRQMAYLEKYKFDHEGNAFHPMIRSFLVPRAVYDALVQNAEDECEDNGKPKKLDVSKAPNQFGVHKNKAKPYFNMITDQAKIYGLVTYLENENNLGSPIKRKSGKILNLLNLRENFGVSQDPLMKSVFLQNFNGRYQAFSSMAQAAEDLSAYFYMYQYLCKLKDTTVDQKFLLAKWLGSHLEGEWKEKLFSADGQVDIGIFESCFLDFLKEYGFSSDDDLQKKFDWLKAVQNVASPVEVNQGSPARAGMFAVSNNENSITENSPSLSNNASPGRNG